MLVDMVEDTAVVVVVAEVRLVVRVILDILEF
jgi:hypothetical protein